MKLLKGIQDGIRWLFGMFGWKDNSTWGIVIKRIWGTCLVICAWTFTVYVYHVITDKPQDDANYEWYPTRFAEDRADDEWQYIRRRERENPEGIIAFEGENGKCGYEIERTGEVIILAQYDYAWFFS